MSDFDFMTMGYGNGEWVSREQLVDWLRCNAAILRHILGESGSFMRIESVLLCLLAKGEAVLAWMRYF